PLRPRGALGTRAPRRARLALGLDVPAGVAVFVPSAGLQGQGRPQGRHAALHRGERPHRRDDGKHPRAAVEAAARLADDRHLRGIHRVLDLVAPLMADFDGLWILAAGPASAVGVYWAIYRYYRNTDKSHAFERE